MSTLDFTKGYWQVPLTPSVRLKTALASGHWQYQVLPFGLPGAPGTFQHFIDIILITYPAGQTPKGWVDGEPP